MSAIKDEYSKRLYSVNILSFPNDTKARAEKGGEKGKEKGDNCTKNGVNGLKNVPFGVIRWI